MIVHTLEELKKAQENGVEEIIVKGDLAIKLHKAYQKQNFVITINLMLLILCIFPITAFAAIIIIAVCRDYEEVIFDIKNKTITIRKKSKAVDN